MFYMQRLFESYQDCLIQIIKLTGWEWDKIHRLAINYMLLEMKNENISTRDFAFSFLDVVDNHRRIYYFCYNIDTYEFTTAFRMNYVRDNSGEGRFVKEFSEVWKGKA